MMKLTLDLFVLLYGVCCYLGVATFAGSTNFREWDRSKWKLWVSSFPLAGVFYIYDFVQSKLK